MMIDHPCEIYGKSLDCQARHLNNAVSRASDALKRATAKEADRITAAFQSLIDRLRGLR